MINWEGKDKDLLALIKYIAEEDKLETSAGVWRRWTWRAAAGVRKRTNDVEKFRQEILERIITMKKILVKINKNREV